jgi:hypothetical protein
MADYGFDGMIKASFVSAIANVAAPTTTELNAGVPLEAQLTADGLAVSSDTASVDTSKLNSTSNSEIVGRDSFTAAVTYVRGSHAYATAIQTALVRGASGYLVVRRDVVSSTAWATGQKVEVYPVQCKRPNPATPAANALQTVEVGFSVTDGGSVRGIDNPATVA